MSDAVQPAPQAETPIAQEAMALFDSMRGSSEPAPVEEPTKPGEQAPGPDEAPAEAAPEETPSEEAAPEGDTAEGEPASRWTQLKTRAEQAEQTAQIVEAQLSEAATLANEWYAETQKLDAQVNDLRYDLEHRDAYIQRLEQTLQQLGYKQDPRDAELLRLQYEHGKLKLSQTRQQQMAEAQAKQAFQAQVDEGAKAWVAKIQAEAKKYELDPKDLATAFVTASKTAAAKPLEEVAKTLALLSPKNRARALAAQGNAAAPKLPVRSGQSARVPHQNLKDEATAWLEAERRRAG